MAKSAKSPKKRVRKTAVAAKPQKGAKTSKPAKKRKVPVVIVASSPVPAASPEAETALVLDRLWATVMARRAADPAVSHSARLLSRGIAKVAQKFGEEAVECLIEAVGQNPAALVAESADVLYHLLVVWVACGVRPEQVWDELRRREGISGIAERSARPKSQALAFRPGTRKIP